MGAVKEDSMTTEQATQCIAPVGWFEPGKDNTPVPCSKPAVWVDDHGLTLCSDHATGHCRRIGPVEGEEA